MYAVRHMFEGKSLDRICYLFMKNTNNKTTGIWSKKKWFLCVSAHHRDEHSYYHVLNAFLCRLPCVVFVAIEPSNPLLSSPLFTFWPKNTPCSRCFFLTLFADTLLSVPLTAYFNQSIKLLQCSGFERVLACFHDQQP